jgi:hypothetical protein
VAARSRIFPKQVQKWNKGLAANPIMTPGRPIGSQTGLIFAADPHGEITQSCLTRLVLSHFARSFEQYGQPDLPTDFNRGVFVSGLQDAGSLCCRLAPDRALLSIHYFADGMSTRERNKASPSFPSP